MSKLSKFAPKKYGNKPKTGKTFKKKSGLGKRQLVKPKGNRIGTEFAINTPIIPPMRQLKLRYAETFSLSTGAAGVLGTQQGMRLNSLYDPNWTGTGHQPYGYDQIVQFYKSYRVNAARVQLIWTTIGGTAEVCCAYELTPTNSGLTLTGQSVDRVTEVNKVSTNVLSASGNTRTVKTDFFVKMKDIFAVSAEKLHSDDKYAAAYNSDPTEIVYLLMAVGSYSGTAGESVSVQVIIDYYATLYDSVVMTQS